MDMMPSWWQMSGSTNDVWSVTFVIRIWRGRLSLWIKITECIALRIITDISESHAPPARMQLFQRKDKPKHQEFEL